MSHTIFIATHAVAATIALIFAVLALRTTRTTRTVLALRITRTVWPVGVHAVATIVMTATLAPSLWLSRATTPMPLQLVFLGLLGLSVVMSYRAVQAWRCRPPVDRPAGPRFVAAVGFNLIGLITGLVTVGALDLGWGSVAVIVAAVTIPVVGHQLLGRAMSAASRATTV